MFFKSEKTNKFSKSMEALSSEFHYNFNTFFSVVFEGVDAERKGWFL